nr:molybdenum cofactor biosynthesis protein MoaE [Corynebacterium liangguodongii]
MRGRRAGHPPADPGYVAEQTGKVIHTAITEAPLEDLVAQARRETSTRAMGALVSFDGVVRDHDGGQGVLGLTYSAHPDAPRVLAEVVGGVVTEHPAVRAWVAHRVGELAIGEIAFLVVTAAAHRGPAFAAAEEIADRVKAEVPIWKEQVMADGTTQWVGL